MKKVLVTGACGYIGARLCKYLATNNYRVTAFDSHKPINQTKWISLMEKLIIGDIRDYKMISKLAEERFEIVIHLISLDHNKSESNPNFVSSINVMPTWNLLDKLTNYGLEKFIYFSTVQVYGSIPSQVIEEDFPTNPINYYGLTHLLSENICNYFNNNSKTKCINVRLSNSYGSPLFEENNCWWLVINDFCKTAVNEGEIKLSSDGSPLRDFIHYSDILNAISLLIESDNNFNKNTFHIASAQTLTILEVAKKVAEIFKNNYNMDISISFMKNSLDKTNKSKSKKYKIGIDRLKNIGFNKNKSLEKGIKEVIEYLL